MTTSINIPEEAVQSAAEALWAKYGTYNRSLGGRWDEEPPEYRDSLRADGRVALEAAAQFIAAQAWDEGRESLALDFAKPLSADGFRASTANPYRKEAPHA